MGWIIGLSIFLVVMLIIYFVVLKGDLLTLVKRHIRNTTKDEAVRQILIDDEINKRVNEVRKENKK